MLSLLIRMATALQRQRLQRTTYGELMALEDMTLKDIGVERSQIRSLVEALFQETENQEVRAEPDVEAQTAAAKTRTRPAYERERRAAA